MNTKNIIKSIFPNKKIDIFAVQIYREIKSEVVDIIYTNVQLKSNIYDSIAKHIKIMTYFIKNSNLHKG